MASGGSKGLASSQGGNEATGALQTGGSVEHTKLNSAGTAAPSLAGIVYRTRLLAVAFSCLASARFDV